MKIKNVSLRPRNRERPTLEIDKLSDDFTAKNAGLKKV